MRSVCIEDYQQHEKDLWILTVPFSDSCSPWSLIVLVNLCGPSDTQLTLPSSDTDRANGSGTGPNSVLLRWVGLKPWEIFCFGDNSDINWIMNFLWMNALFKKKNSLIRNKKNCKLFAIYPILEVRIIVVLYCIPY